MSEHELHTRVHDAYESFGPSNESYDRVLASLKDAQAEQIKQTKAPRRLKAWWVLAPLAAACAVAAVIVSMNTGSASSAQNATQNTAGEAVAVDKNVEAEEAALMQNASEDGAWASSSMLVTLADGTAFTVGEELVDAPTWSKTEDAVAVDEATNEERPCTVADRAYVRFEGQQTWYKLELTE